MTQKRGKRITIEIPTTAHEDLVVLSRLKSLYEHRDCRPTGLAKEVFLAGLANALHLEPASAGYNR